MKLRSNMVRGCSWLAVLGLFPSAASACPTCQLGLAEHWHTQLAYAVSIGLLMGVPFLLLAGWCLALQRWSQPAPDDALGGGAEASAADG